MPRQEFTFSSSGNSVVRTVYPDGGKSLLTWVQMRDANLKGEDAHSAFDYTFLRKTTPPKDKYSSEIIHAVDLFCGCGGLSLGAREACRALGKRFRMVAALDKDPVFLKVYEANFPSSRTYEHAIEEIIDGDIDAPVTENESILLRELGNVKILLAGPPCQGHSNLNNHTRRDDERNALYLRVARFVEIAKPEHILIENVPAVVHGRERAVQRSINVIRRLGYEVESDVVDLATIGVPQRRKRHIVLASLTKKLSISEIIERHHVKYERSVRWAICDLEDEVPDGDFTTPSRLSKTNMKRIRYLHENDIYDLPNRHRPPCHKNDHSYLSMYGRIRYDEPSQTITCGFLSPGQGRFIHPTRLRTLTPHEAARLQFFPDFFDFSSAESRGSLSNMIGNAVPMKLPYIFCLELLE